MSASRARATLVLLAALLVAGWVWPSRSADLPRSAVVNGVVVSDGTTFAAVVERLRSGGSYYAVMGDELRRRNYPTSSVFNWRPPLHLVAVAAVPWSVAHGVLTCLLALTFGLAMTLRWSDRPSRIAASGLFLGLVVMQAATDAIFLSEVWAGTLIGLSALALLHGRHGAAVALGVLGLFVRELSGVYVVTLGAVLLLERRWRASVALGAGLMLFAGYFWWHATQVQTHQVAGDFTGGDSHWIAVGGLPFLLSTVHRLGWLRILPPWLDAPVLTLAAAGVAGPATPRIVRLASAAYAVLFLVAGQPFNDYWGGVVAPLWALACAGGASHLRETAAAVRGPGG